MINICDTPPDAFRKLRKVSFVAVYRRQIENVARAAPMICLQLTGLQRVLQASDDVFFTAHGKPLYFQRVSEQ